MMALSKTERAWSAGSSRDQHRWDIDAATAASLIVLGALAVPAAAVGFWLGRRFRVVRR